MVANSKKIRVSIKKVSSGWKGTVTSLITGKHVSHVLSNPKKATTDALELAELENYDSVNLSMGWTYEYHWK